MTPRNELERLAELRGASKRMHDYLRHYDALFHDRRSEVAKVLEIGLQNVAQEGTSITMWADYFPNARIVGIDVIPERTNLASDRIAVEIMDSSNPDAGADIEARHGSEFDLIIDDGSHWYADQVATFRNFWPLLREGGVYVVEDLVCGDGPHRYYAVRAFAELIDGLNYIAPGVSTGHWWQEKALPAEADPIVNSLDSVTFVRNAVFITKGRNPHGNPWLAELSRQQTGPIEDTPARAGKEPAKLLRSALAILRDRYRRFLVPRIYARPPTFLDRLLARMR